MSPRVMTAMSAIEHLCGVLADENHHELAEAIRSAMESYVGELDYTDMPIRTWNELGSAVDAAVAAAAKGAPGSAPC